MSFRAHGNWCGPGWSAGKYQKSSLEDYPAEDGVDECCKHHDQDIARNRSFSDSNSAFRSCLEPHGIRGKLFSTAVDVAEKAGYNPNPARTNSGNSEDNLSIMSSEDTRPGKQTPKDGHASTARPQNKRGKGGRGKKKNGNGPGQKPKGAQNGQNKKNGGGYFGKKNRGNSNGLRQFRQKLTAPVDRMRRYHKFRQVRELSVREVTIIRLLAVVVLEILLETIC